MIALAGKQSDDIRIDESFGLISDELTEAVVSTEETSRGNGSDTAILWMYEISHGQWKEISRRVRGPESSQLSYLGFGHTRIGIAQDRNCQVSAVRQG